MMKPNFLVFVVDQMQSRTLSCHGHPDLKTPHIDQLAYRSPALTATTRYACLPARRY